MVCVYSAVDRGEGRLSTLGRRLLVGHSAPSCCHLPLTELLAGLQHHQFSKKNAFWAGPQGETFRAWAELGNLECWPG